MICAVDIDKLKVLRYLFIFPCLWRYNQCWSDACIFITVRKIFVNYTIFRKRIITRWQKKMRITFHHYLYQGLSIPYPKIQNLYQNISCTPKINTPTTYSQKLKIRKFFKMLQNPKFLSTYMTLKGNANWSISDYEFSD